MAALRDVGRSATLEEAAGMVAFLASEDAVFFN
jgi:hypothetical protein